MLTACELLMCVPAVNFCVGLLRGSHSTFPGEAPGSAGQPSHPQLDELQTHLRLD